MDIMKDTWLNTITILVLHLSNLACNACQYGTEYRGQCECWTGYKEADCSVYDSSLLPNLNSRSAMNLAGVVYWGTQWTFVDVMQTAMWWVTQRTDSGDWNTNEHHLIPWREDGYPQYLPEANMRLTTLVLRDNPWAPAGRYVVLYEGQGDLLFGFSATEVSRGPGRIELDVVPENSGIKMELTNVDQNDPIRNVRVIMPGFEDRYEQFPFHPTLLEFVRKLNVIRYMDWGNTNNYPENITWADRKQMTFYTQADGPERRGVSYEYMVHLSNIAGASPWINIPHAADDEYVTNMATLFRDNLRPDLRIYVEYSNEVWNSQFTQNQYAGQKGIELNFTSPDTPWEGAWKYTSYRSVQIFDIFKTVFGESERHRLELILPTQKANPYVTRQIVSFQDAYQHADTIALTAYFCGHLGNEAMRDFVSASTIDQLFDNCTATFPEEQQTFIEQLEVAQEFGLEVLTYEAGQHIVVVRYDDEENTNKFIEMNRSPRMQDVMEEWMSMYHSTVVENEINQEFPAGLWAQFSSVLQPGVSGSWGILEYTTQDQYAAPKYLAVHEYLNRFTSSYDGPRCSFVDTSGPDAFGCYRLNEGDPYGCYWTQTNGQEWTALPDPPDPDYLYITLDAVNTEVLQVFVRAVNRLDITTYYTIYIGDMVWSQISAADYYNNIYLLPENTTYSLPSGVTNGLDTEAYFCP